MKDAKPARKRALIRDGRVILSPTAYVNYYKRCPYSLKLMMERRPSKKDHRLALDGLVVQEVMDRWFMKNRLRDADYPSKILQRVLSTRIRIPGMVLRNGETEEGLQQTFSTLVDNYIGLLRAENLLDLRRVRTEYWYGTYEDPLPMTDTWLFAGASDYFKMTRKGDLIYDGKTSYRVGTADLDQLYMYALAHEKKLGRPVRYVGFLYIRHGVKKMFPFTPRKREETLARVDVACRNVLGSLLAPNPRTATCGRCTFEPDCSFATQSPSKHSRGASRGQGRE